MGERGQGGVWRPTYQDHKTKETKASTVWWIWYPVRGVKKRESSHSTRRQDAVRLLRRRIERLGTGRPVGPEIEKTTFLDLKKMILDDYRANGRRSVDRLERSLAHLEDFFGRDRALEITSDRVTEYAAHRQEQQQEGQRLEERGPAANATINRELTALKRMFRLAERAEKVGQRPYIGLLHESNVRKGFFEWAEFRGVTGHLPQHLKAAVETAYVTGWRISSELLTRQKHHVDMVNGWLRLEPGETKNGEGRQFPLTDELRTILERQLAMTRELEVARGVVIPWLFHRNGRRIRNFRRAWRTACERAGVPGKIPHDFRRTAVRNLERAGVPRSAAMAMVGHKTQSIYARYAIADESMLRDGAGRLATLHQHEADSASRSTGVVVPIGQSSVKAGGSVRG